MPTSLPEPELKLGLARERPRIGLARKRKRLCLQPKHEMLSKHAVVTNACQALQGSVS